MSIFQSFILPALVVSAVSITAGCVDLTPCQRGAEGCACREVPQGSTESGCDAATDGTAICAAGTCFVQRATTDEFVCYDACAYRQSGLCDDGGPDADFPDGCALGSDCSDCGPRPNPCAGTAAPVFCPQSPDNCWAANTDCLTVRTCAASATPMAFIGCMTGQAVDCAASMGPKCVTTNPCALSDPPSPSRCIAEVACVGAYIDCNSLMICNGKTLGCYQGEHVVCNVGAPPACSP